VAQLAAEAISSAFGVNLPELQPGEPVANPAIGATGDDSAPPQEFDALGSPESIAAATKNVAAAVSIAVAAAGAAGAAAAAGAAGSAAGAGAGAGSSGSSSGGSNSGGSSDSSDARRPELALDSDSMSGQSEDEWTPKTYAKKLFAETGLTPGWGDSLPIFAATAVTFVDTPAVKLANAVAKRAPILGKALQNGAYLRGMLGSAAWLLPLANLLLAVASVFINAQLNPGLAMSPPWALFLGMAVIAVFDAFAGMLAAAVFIAGSLAVLVAGSGFQTLPSWVVFVGVALALFGPGFLITGFRKLNRRPERSVRYWWERLTDFFVCSFLAAWLISSISSSMPALAGHTMPVANHIGDLALAGALAGAGRVLLEEIAGRAFPVRTNWHSFVQFPESTTRGEGLGLAFKSLLWGAIASSMFGFSWQIIVGTALFLAPSFLSLFSDRLPNSTFLWRVLPEGLPGMALNLALGSAAAIGLAFFGGATPEVAKYTFVLMPLPIMAIGILKEFGRHGGPGEKRPGKKNVWLYRVGGLVMFMVTLKLAGVF
jgi:hypothetical protein